MAMNPKPLVLTKSLALWKRATQRLAYGTMTRSKHPSAYAMGAYPVYFSRGKGAYIRDVDGNRYIDYVNGLGPIILGHRYEPVERAVRAQAKQLPISSLLAPVEVEAAEAVCGAVPCAERVRFFKTGAETTAAAARIARAFTGRDKIVGCGYHGWIDTIASTRTDDQGIPKAIQDLNIAGPWNDAKKLEEIFAANAGQIACVIIQPCSYVNQNEGLDYLRVAKALCHRNGALLVYDEIVTGFRLALGGAQEHWGVIPDLACFAKAMANGYPVACTAGRADVMAVLDKVVISSTYGGEALSLAAVVACIKEHRKHETWQVIARRGRKLMDGLNAAAKRHGVSALWCGWPQMASFAFKYPDAATNADAMTFWLQENAKRGVLYRRGGLNFVTFSHGEREIARSVEAGDEVLSLLAGAMSKGDLKRRIEAGQVTKGMYER